MSVHTTRETSPSSSPRTRRFRTGARSSPETRSWPQRPWTASSTAPRSFTCVETAIGYAKSAWPRRAPQAHPPRWSSEEEGPVGGVGNAQRFPRGCGKPAVRGFPWPRRLPQAWRSTRTICRCTHISVAHYQPKGGQFSMSAEGQFSVSVDKGIVPEREHSRAFNDAGQPAGVIIAVGREQVWRSTRTICRCIRMSVAHYQPKRGQISVSVRGSVFHDRSRGHTTRRERAGRAERAASSRAKEFSTRRREEAAHLGLNSRVTLSEEQIACPEERRSDRRSPKPTV